MMMLHERIKQKLDEKQLKQADIARATGKSTAAVAKWMSGQNTPKTESLIKIAKLLGVSQEWLLTGKQPKAIEPNANDDFVKMEFWDGETPLYEEEFEVPFYKDVEFLGGDGWADEAFDDGRRKLRYAYTAARRAGANPAKIICTTLKGDSMEELILDGSMIAIDTSKTEIREGKIYAFRHGHMLRVKYLIPRPDGGLIIKSHNSKYEDEVITGEEIDSENIQIIGWVWNWSSLLVW